MLNGLDICAGGGIGSAVWKEFGGRTVCYVERDPYCQQLLQARMRDGVICDAPIWDDLRTFDGRPWRDRVDFLFGGIPCQPYSVAGQRRGAADERDLWPDTRRIIREIRPRLVLIENVPGLLARGMGRILGEFASDGLDAEWATISAADVGAPHLRKRVWIVAYTAQLYHNDKNYYTSDCQGEVSQSRSGNGKKDVADAKGQSLGAGLCEGEQAGQRRRRLGDGDSAGNWWAAEPDVDRVADGIPNWVDRLRVLGNGWVPQVAAVVMARCAELLGATLMEAETALRIPEAVAEAQPAQPQMDTWPDEA